MPALMTCAVCPRSWSGLICGVWPHRVVGRIVERGVVEVRFNRSRFDGRKRFDKRAWRRYGSKSKWWDTVWAFKVRIVGSTRHCDRCAEVGRGRVRGMDAAPAQTSFPFVRRVVSAVFRMVVSSENAGYRRSWRVSSAVQTVLLKPVRTCDSGGRCGWTGSFWRAKQGRSPPR